MLGKYIQYTCAYFNKPNMTLDEAQLNKMKLIAKKTTFKTWDESIRYRLRIWFTWILFSKRI